MAMSCCLQDKFKKYSLGTEPGETPDSWNDNSQLHPVQKTKEIHGFLWISCKSVAKIRQKT